jgi:hypothetical protein
MTQIFLLHSWLKLYQFWNSQITLCRLLIEIFLFSRLKKILPKFINEDQTGYIKNRFIGFNLRQIQDVIDYSNIYKIEGAIIFLDFSKAFDSLEWDFMFSTLKKTVADLRDTYLK